MLAVHRLRLVCAGEARHHDGAISVARQRRGAHVAAHARRAEPNPLSQRGDFVSDLLANLGEQDAVQLDAVQLADLKLGTASTVIKKILRKNMQDFHEILRKFTEIL